MDPTLYYIIHIMKKDAENLKVEVTEIMEPLQCPYLTFERDRLCFGSNK